jgi:hypothetical protein
VVTHLTTNPPVCSLNMVDRTGNLVFYNLWPNVIGMVVLSLYGEREIQNVAARSVVLGHTIMEITSEKSS